MLKNIPLGGFLPPSEMLSGYIDASNEQKIDSRGVPKAILVAYSGGADSSCLLRLLSDWCAQNRTMLYAAHVNHGIRGREALRDRDFCKKECEKLGVELFILNADVPKIAAESGKSIESAARDVRYEFFADIMTRKNIPVLATAHNADDNLETVLFRLARGTAARGLCGIPPVRQMENGALVVRPLLGCSKKDIIEYCSKNSIDFVFDSTNAETLYARNSIRAGALPVLFEINPAAAEAALRSCRILRKDCDYLDSLAKKYIAENDSNLISRIGELEDPILFRVLQRLYAKVCGRMIEYDHLASLKGLIKKGRELSSIDLPGNITAKIQGGRLAFLESTKAEEIISLPPTELAEGDNILGSGYVLRVEKDFSTFSSQTTQQIQTTSENIYKLFTHVYIQSDKINGILCARGRLSGDKIRSGGISRDVRKLYSEKKLAVEERHGYPIVYDGEGILWIPNMALRDGIKANEKNGSNVWKLTIFRKL